MIAEAHIGAFGALGVGGVAAFVVGALMMFPARVPGSTLSGGVVAGAAIDASLAAGNRVKIVGRDGLVLRVEGIRPA